MLFSNEIVFRGHPDKVADQISDRILMECLKQDKYSRVAVETVGGKKYIVVTGEISTNAKLDVEYLIKDTLKNVGYKTDYEIINDIGIQSKDISQGVDYGGAGDQGMMFGYATNETKEMLPKAVVILQKLSKWYDEVRQVDPRFLPDGKAQITGYYDSNNRLAKIKTFTISYNNTEIDRDETDMIIKNKVIQLANEFDLSIEEILINPTGKFFIPILVFLTILKLGYVKAPPDEAYIISGLRSKIVVGKAAIRIPFLERVDKLSLSVMTVDVKTGEYVPTNDYINVMDGVYHFN